MSDSRSSTMLKLQKKLEEPQSQTDTTQKPPALAANQSAAVKSTIKNLTVAYHPNGQFHPCKGRVFKEVSGNTTVLQLKNATFNNWEFKPAKGTEHRFALFSGYNELPESSTLEKQGITSGSILRIHRMQVIGH